LTARKGRLRQVGHSGSTDDDTLDPTSSLGSGGADDLISSKYRHSYV